MLLRISLPQELVNEIVGNLLDNADLEACSLVSRSWGYPASSRLFRHVRVCPEKVEDWFSRPPESVQKMAPHIVKFELSADPVDPWGAPPFYWDDSKGLLTLMISSLASSPVQCLRIESFGVEGFNKITLEQCFEPICRSLRSLEFNTLAACTDATIYLISLFPNLDNIDTGEVMPALIELAPEWDGCGIKHSPKLSGTLRFSNKPGVTDDSKLLAGIASLSPRFRTISPGKITYLNSSALSMLVEACAETVESVPFLWWGYDAYLPPNLFIPCKKLRTVGFGLWEDDSTAVQSALSSITSEHLSTVSLELAYPYWYLKCSTCEQPCPQWWGGLESVLCHLADQRLVRGASPLVLEIVWWRSAGHEGDCGTLPRPDTIIPRFREKGLIRFVESEASNQCDHCVEIFAAAHRASRST